MTRQELAATVTAIEAASAECSLAWQQYEQSKQAGDTAGARASKAAFADANTNRAALARSIGAAVVMDSRELARALIDLIMLSHYAARGETDPKLDTVRDTIRTARLK